MNHARRFRALRQQLKRAQIEAVLVTHLPDVRYLCGFTGSNAALAITPKAAVLFTDGRYTVQAREQVKAARVVIAAASALREACAFLEESQADQAAFDPEHTTVSSLNVMRSALKTARLRKNFFQPLEAPCFQICDSSRTTTSSASWSGLRSRVAHCLRNCCRRFEAA